jgi:hypothetical protein
MKTIGKDEDISVGEPVQFVLDTYDGSGCLTNPYQIERATIYFVSREFTDTTASEYTVEFADGELQAKYDADMQAVCIKAKKMARAASTGPVVLSGLYSVDGISLSSGDRVLVKNQTNKVENGIYVASEQSWKRSSDMPEGKEAAGGAYLFVENGISNIGTGWMLAGLDEKTPGEDELNFVMFASDWKPESPDETESENLRNLSILRRRLESSKVSSSFFYKDAVPVKTFGGGVDAGTQELFPAWLNPEEVPAGERLKVMSDNILVRAEGENGELLGKFILEWDTDGAREGDYFICWSWRPTFGDEVLSAHQFFHLGGNDYATTSIPTHRSKSEKYEMLLDRYTPNMFKTRISDSDLAPEVISEFNNAVAKGFTFIENQANAVIDLLDSNATHEQFLPALSNMFNLKIKSSDPTLWRRQIKKAVPNFKRKGSVSGLREVMGDAGMKLLRLARMWQVVPKYTWQEHFVFSTNNEFKLSKTPVMPLDGNFKLWLKRKGQKDWTLLSETSSSSSSSGHWSEKFVTMAGGMMTWTTNEDRKLREGDSVRVLYKIRNIPSGEVAKEDYIRSLPLMDDRDETLQEYPPKNWNLHLVEEDDEYFDVLVPVRHPFSDPIVWGRVRTEFPYSENLYNMEEYNGSKRDSLNPCDIDKEFMDSCGQCASSKFNVDVEIEMLSDDRFKELKQVVQEYMPFHAVPNSFGLWGSLNEFVRQSEESVRAMIQFSREDVTLAGEGQNIFSKDVYRSDIEKVRRDVLASMDPVNSPGGSANWAGSIRNSRTLLLPRTSNEEGDLLEEDFKGLTSGFDSHNIKIGQIYEDPFDNGNLLEVLGSTTKYYSVSSVGPSGAEVKGDVEIGPLFEYRLSNLIGDFNIDIEQYQEVVFEDNDADFSILGIVSKHDVDSGLATGLVWRLHFESSEYLVLNVLPDGRLLLETVSTISPVSGWKLFEGSVSKKSGTGGSKKTKNYGLVEINSPATQVRDLFVSGDFVYAGWTSSLSRYKIKFFHKELNRFYIEDYLGGDVGGLDVKVYRRIMDKKIGQFGCDTLMLSAADDLSSVNKDDCLVFIDEEYYTISGVEGRSARLSGPQGSCGTSPSNVQFKIYRFTKENLILSEKQVPPYDKKPPEYEFRQIGRSGEAIITSSQGAELGALSSILNSSGSVDVMTQDETIKYEIEYKEQK